MSLVMIRCPVSGATVSTAIEMEPGVFRQLPNLPGRMACSACGQDHAWTIRSAWLLGEPHMVAEAVSNEAA